MGSDISYVSCTADWESCKVDGDYKHGSGQIEINGQIYENGIVAHAPGKVTFQLDGLFDKLTTCIGISKVADAPNCGVTSGDAKFRVLGDGQVLEDWKVKTSPEDSTCFDVDITDVNELVLETAKKDSKGCNLSTWADAKVHKRGYSGFIYFQGIKVL